MSFLFQANYWTSRFKSPGYSVAEMEDQTGKVAIVTGANLGLGYETMVALGAKGAHVFLACRNQQRAEEAIERAKIEIKLLRADKFKKSWVGKEKRNKFMKYFCGKWKSKSKRGGKKDEEGNDNGDDEDDDDDDEDPNEGFEDDGFEPKLEFLHLDLNDMNHCRAAAAAFVLKGLPLHLLVNNAGIFTTFGLSADGIEQHFAVNHMGHFVFTLGLLDVLKSTQPASRVVVLTSCSYEVPLGHLRLDLSTDKLTGDTRAPERFYARSKLANMLFAKGLAARLENEKVYVNAVHPGIVSTSIAHSSRVNPRWIYGKLSSVLHPWVGTNAAKGALTQLWAATAPKIEQDNLRGRYFIPVGVQLQPIPYVDNKENQDKFWDFSMGLMNEKLDLATKEKGKEKMKEESGDEAKMEPEEIIIARGGERVTRLGDKETTTMVEPSIESTDATVSALEIGTIPHQTKDGSGSESVDLSLPGVESLRIDEL